MASALSSLLLLGALGAPQALPPTAGAEREPDASASIEDALARGEAILLEMQESLDDGAAEVEHGEWPYEGVYRKRGQIPIGYRVGGTSIAARALLELDRWDDVPRRRAAVERATDFVLAALDDEDMSAGFSGGYDVRGWGHAYALDFLVRLRAQGRVPAGRANDVTAAIRFLIAAIESTELEDRGGWNYARGRRGGRPSTFMTASTLQALFAAAAADEEVDADVVTRAVDALDAARLTSGAYQYATHPARQTGEGFEAVEGATGRIPICETTLFAAGRGDVARLRAGVEAFFEHWQFLEDRRRKTGTHEGPYRIAPYYFYFAHFYAAQAIELLPEDEREAARARLHDLFWKVREESGGWNDRVFPRSENFGTAMALLALRAPHLPPPAGWQDEPAGR